MAYNYDKFDINMTEFVRDNNIQSSTGYLLITSLKDKFTYVYEYKNKWELEYKWSSFWNIIIYPFCTTGCKSYASMTYCYT